MICFPPALLYTEDYLPYKVSNHNELPIHHCQVVVAMQTQQLDCANAPDLRHDSVHVCILHMHVQVGPVPTRLLIISVLSLRLGCRA